MDLREAKEHLGRVKPYYLRNETVRALGSAVMGVKGVVSLNIQPGMDVRGLIREAIQFLSRDEIVRAHCVAPLGYQPGQERQLLGQLAAAYKSLLEAQQRESYDEAAARKLKLDHAYNAGLRALELGQVSEADAAFAEALNYHRNENRIFAFMAKALLEAGEPKRALAYVKKGLELMPVDVELLQLLETATQMKTRDAG